MMPLHSSEVFSILIISSLSLITIFIYLFVKYQYSYWHRRNVKCLPPTFPFGNYRKNVLQILSIGEVCAEIYRNTNEPFIGVFGAFRPMLVICDPNLVRNIFVKDFHHFVDRGIYFDEKRDPLSAHLFTICGDKWKNLRSKLTPAFSSSRLRAMFSTLVECGLSLETVMEETAKNQKEFNVRECIACYSINVIASVAYGLDVDCILEPEHPFRQNGRKFFARSWRNGLRNFCRFVCPQLMHLLGMRFIDNDVEAFFFDLVERMIELREKQKIVRKDIFQMLIQLRNTGKVHENQWDTVIAKDEKNKMLTLNEMVAQVFVLFVAGFETSSSTISYCLYELAKNPDIQGQVQAEIDSVLAKTNGQITFDAVNEMKFLDACIDETLRKYPPSPFINRQCTEDYVIPGTNVVIEKGIVVQIPVYGFHHDERYYPNPKEFNPNRFFNGEKKSFAEMPYMPFGDGPRNCIGMRMGKVETKIGIVLMLQNFNYSLGDQLVGMELEISPSSFVMAPKTNIMLKVQFRDGRELKNSQKNGALASCK